MFELGKLTLELGRKELRYPARFLVDADIDTAVIGNNSIRTHIVAIIGDLARHFCVGWWRLLVSMIVIIMVGGMKRVVVVILITNII